ncbi:MAG: hypothetical protein ACFCU4_07795 [Puniceicoccaceae bacterium]
MSVKTIALPASGIRYPGMAKLASVSLSVGLIFSLIALLGLFWGFVDNESRYAISYLLGFSFWYSVLVGMLFIVLLTYIFDAGWSIIIRRQLEHFLGAFPWLTLLFLPLIVIPWFTPEPGILWKWLDPNYVLNTGETVGQDVLFVEKSPYLNQTFFTIRSVVFLGVLSLLAIGFRRLSFRNDSTGDPANFASGRKLAGLGIFVAAFAVTFSAIDWFKSLEYHWFSTMFGVWFFSASMRAALAVIGITCVLLASFGYLKGIYNKAHQYDLGNLTLAFTIFWAYISFSQYFLIYQANIPEETFWYTIRQFGTDDLRNSWFTVSMLLVFAHFLFPFLFLLIYKNKIRTVTYVFILGWILVFHLLDLYWNILPGKKTDLSEILGYRIREFSISFFDLAAIIGFGGVVLWAFFRSSSQQWGIPVRDPYINESINHHE